MKAIVRSIIGFLSVLCCLCLLFFVPWLNRRSVSGAAEWVLLVLALFLLCRVVISFGRYQSNTKLLRGRKPAWQWVLILLLLVGSVIYGSLTIIQDFESRQNPVFSEAKRTFELSTTAKSELGQPLKIGWPIHEGLEVMGDSGKVELSIPVSGSFGKAILYVAGTKANGVWKTDRVDLIVHGMYLRQDLLTGRSEDYNAP